VSKLREGKSIDDIIASLSHVGPNSALLWWTPMATTMVIIVQLF
jgi:hypothetical protein